MAKVFTMRLQKWGRNWSDSDSAINRHKKDSDLDSAIIPRKKECKRDIDDLTAVTQTELMQSAHQRESHKTFDPHQSNRPTVAGPTERLKGSNLRQPERGASNLQH
jgi:hypothetical protein